MTKLRGSTAPSAARRVHLLMFNADGSGGVARTVINLANHLADDHEVEIISLYRRRDRPRFPVDARVKVTYLEDVRATDSSSRFVRAKDQPERGRIRAALDRRPTRLRPEPAESQMSLLTDLLLRRKLGSLRSGVLVSTRPSLHLASARWASRRVTTIGQDHLNFPARFGNRHQAAVLRTAVPGLDGYVVLTAADADDYRQTLPGSRTRIAVIRNGLPWPVAPAGAALDEKVVVAVGRLAPEKGFDRLIDAFAPLAADHPDWRLHLYGQGRERGPLEAQIAERGLQDHVELKGYTDDMRGVLSSASVFAMSSRSEGFPMVLIEAMSVGLPLVSFDCPRGPGEIVHDGKNGRLVEDGDLAGFTAALRLLVEDEGLRRRLGERALADATQFQISAIGAEWRRLFDELDGAPRG